MKKLFSVIAIHCNQAFQIKQCVCQTIIYCWCFAQKFISQRVATLVPLLVTVLEFGTQLKNLNPVVGKVFPCEPLT